MGDVLASGAAWLAGQLQAHAAGDVTYSRGAQSVVLKAAKGTSDAEAVEEEGVVIRTRALDFILRASDLLLGGVETQPVEGDVISETAGGQTHRYAVMPLGGEPGWRWCDTARQMIRVHTRWLETV